jgi:hypothetical protein
VLISVLNEDFNFKRIKVIFYFVFCNRIDYLENRVLQKIGLFLIRRSNRNPSTNYPIDLSLPYVPI